jgi:hypothetical protein
LIQESQSLQVRHNDGRPLHKKHPFHHQTQLQQTSAIQKQEDIPSKDSHRVGKVVEQMLDVPTFS